MLTNILSLLGVGLLWGATNPFIKRASAGVESIDTGSKWRNLVMEFRMIGSRLHYWLPFLLNQCGSVLYVWCLQSFSMIAAVPIANSLSFAFTAIAGYLLGEPIPGRKVVIGATLICLGSSLMIYDKFIREEQEIPLEFTPI